MAFWDRLVSGIGNILRTIAGDTEEAAEEELEEEDATVSEDYPGAGGYIPEEDDVYEEPSEFDEVTLYDADGRVLDTMTKQEWMDGLVDMDREQIRYYWRGQTHMDIIFQLWALGLWDMGEGSEDWAEFREGYEEAHPGAIHYSPMYGR